MCMVRKKFFHKIILFFLLFFVASSMTACEKAPQEVAEEVEEQEELTMEMLESEQYVSIREAKEQIKRLEGQTINGISFPKKIPMPDIQSISALKLTPWHWNDEQDMVQAISGLWSGYDTVDWSKVKEEIYNPDHERLLGKIKEDKQTGFFYGYDVCGYYVGDSLNDTELNMSACVATYDFEWGDTASEADRYLMEDGEISVADAVRDTEEKLNQYLSIIEKNQFQYKIQHLYVLKNPDTGFHDYAMIIGRVYQGIAMDTCSDFLLQEGKYYDKVHTGAHFSAVMRHRNSLDSIVNGVESLEIESESEKDSVISPFWAVQQIDQEIAHLSGLNFAYCGLFYIMEQDNEKKQDQEQGTSGIVSEGDSSFLRPMWLFMAAGEKSSAMHTNDWRGNSVLVDAIDGTLWYYQGTIPY